MADLNLTHITASKRDNISMDRKKYFMLSPHEMSYHMASEGYH